MSGFRKLVELSDKACRAELEDYYVVSKARMENHIYCLEGGAAEIQKLKAEVECIENKNLRVEVEVEELQAKNVLLREALEDLLNNPYREGTSFYEKVVEKCRQALSSQKLEVER